MTSTLHNGIQLPAEWPPRHLDPASDAPMPVPYLDNPPDVIPIDLGRQLFVDDFLIAESALERVFHQPRKHDGNPVFASITPWKRDGIHPAAVPKSGGVRWDPAARCLKMWYEDGWLGSQAFAVSSDGLHWERAVQNIVPGMRPDSGTVWLDLEDREPSRRYKMLLREPQEEIGGALEGPGHCLVSRDGIHWIAPIPTGRMGDRSTMFYNPFRKMWAHSIRSYESGRCRAYREHPDFLAGAAWSEQERVFWCRADRLDLPDPVIGQAAQLYNLDAVAYESLMVGLFTIHLGPENRICEAQGRPKTTELKIAFSRDGFHWHRPDRRAFIPAAREVGLWDRGYVQSVGGVCVIVGDELWFYYTGFRGDPANHRDRHGYHAGMYAHGATGIAKLRRDGFASLRAGAVEQSVLTRPVTFTGEHLFVNVAGTLRVEVCTQKGLPIPGFTAADCLETTGDQTKAGVRWRENASLAPLAGQPVRFRFYLQHGDLYAFWVASGPAGASAGYVAAGGPAFTTYQDCE
jgi:hypothetical protein